MFRKWQVLIGLGAVLLSSIACNLPVNVGSSNQPEVVVTTPPVSESDTPVPTTQPLTLVALQNTTYRSPDWGEYQLANGIYYRTPTAPGESAEIYTSQLDESFVTGDLNTDGVEDAVVFLRTQNGGTGHFVELAAMLNQNGTPYNISTVFLGDRVVVESAQIVDGVIILAMRVQGPNDGLCCPSQLETWKFQLQNDQLVRLP